MRKSPKDIYTELGISRAAFYRAYSALIEEGIIEGEDPDLQKLVIKRPVSDLRQQSQSVDSESQIVDNESQIVDNPYQSVDSESPSVENKSSNSPQASSSDNFPDFSPDSYLHCYSNLFSDSLSDKERERKEQEFKILQYSRRNSSRRNYQSWLPLLSGSAAPISCITREVDQV